MVYSCVGTVPGYIDFVIVSVLVGNLFKFLTRIILKL